MNIALKWMVLISCVVFIPPLLIGLIRKTKARLQGRIGASICQPIFDLAKLFAKDELLSEISNGMLRSASVVSASVAVLIALSSPWLPGMPVLFHSDIFIFVYLFALLRFFTVLSALDTASAFGAFAASREVTIAVLVEPAVMLCFIALAVVAGTTDLSAIFAFTADNLSIYPGLWAMAGCGLYLASLVELSRMPADDPTTHLELTMVHEAMIIENSGPNLALVEYASALKMLILMGLSGQCFLHATTAVLKLHHTIYSLGGLLALFVMVGFIAVIESTSVKLRWTKLPEFIAYAVTFGLLCAMYSLGTLR